MTDTAPGGTPNQFERDKLGTADRSQSEARIEGLRQQGGVFVDAVRATRMPMVLTDPSLPGNPIVFANQSFLKLSGYGPDEVLGQQPHFMNGPDTDPEDAERFRRILEEDRDGVVETVQYAKGGRRFVATVLLSAFKDDAGRTLHHFLSWCDVTRRVDAEDAVADLRRMQAAFREKEERQRFLLALGDEMRAQRSANKKIEIAARQLGERLNASRVLYAEYDDIKNVANIFNGWFADGAQAFPTVMHLEDYEGEVLNDLRAGRTVRVDNVGLLIEQPAYAAIADVGVQALLSVPLIVGGRLAVNVSVHQHEPRHWTEEDVALVEEMAERLWAEVVRARAESTLRESEERLRLIVENARDYAIFTTDPEGRIDQWHAGAEAVFGWSAEEIAGQPVEITFTLEDRALGEPRKEREQAAREGRAPNVRWHVRKDGTRVFIEGITTALTAQDGNLVGFLKIGQDVTERKRAEEHQRTLLAELQHRVRNTLGVVRSIARRTAERSETVDEMASHFQGRLDAFSRVQAIVTRNPEAGIDLESLIEDELLAHAAREGESLTVEGPEISLKARAAESLSLAIHELATNAVKYGALSAERGRIAVRWERLKPNGTELLRLSWEEHGVDMPPGPPARRGFGLELLQRTLPYDLGAETEVEFRPGGLRFEMTMPLRPDVLAGGDDSG